MFFPEMDELQSERKHRCAQPSDANCLFGTQMDFVNAFENVINKHDLSSCIGMRIRFVQVNQQISMHISTVKSAHSNEQIEIILCRGDQQDCNSTNFEKAPMQHSCSWLFAIVIHVIVDGWLLNCSEMSVELSLCFNFAEIKTGHHFSLGWWFKGVDHKKSKVC